MRTVVPFLIFILSAPFTFATDDALPPLEETLAESARASCWERVCTQCMILGDDSAEWIGSALLEAEDYLKTPCDFTKTNSSAARILRPEIEHHRAELKASKEHLETVMRTTNAASEDEFRDTYNRLHPLAVLFARRINSHLSHLEHWEESKAIVDANLDDDDSVSGTFGCIMVCGRQSIGYRSYWYRTKDHTD